MRKRASHNLLWVDAVCINQSNVDERNHQVGLMDRIYRKATRVYVCIEDPEKSYPELMDWLSPDGAYERPSVKMLNQLRELLGCRYFSRVWVMQEVALARALTLHVNRGEVKLTQKALFRLRNVCESNVIPIPGPLDLMMLPTNCDVAWSLKDHLRRSLSAECSEVRDRVYGIHSLLGPQAKSMISVDYSESVDDALSDAVAACIADAGSLQILGHVQWPAEYADVSTTCTFSVQQFESFLHDTDRLWSQKNTSIAGWKPLVHFGRQEAISFDAQNITWEAQSSQVHIVSGPRPEGQILPYIRVRAYWLGSCKGSTLVGNVRKKCKGYKTEMGL